jgi:hypothetical protein
MFGTSAVLADSNRVARAESVRTNVAGSLFHRNPDIAGYRWDNSDSLAADSHSPAAFEEPRLGDAGAGSRFTSQAADVTGANTLGSSKFKWAVRSSAEQSTYKWGLRSTSDQSTYKWGLRSTSDQSTYKWGLRSTSGQSTYKWGLR